MQFIFLHCLEIVEKETQFSRKAAIKIEGKEIISSAFTSYSSYDEIKIE